MVWKSTRKCFILMSANEIKSLLCISSAPKFITFPETVEEIFSKRLIKYNWKNRFCRTCSEIRRKQPTLFYIVLNIPANNNEQQRKTTTTNTVTLISNTKKTPICSLRIPQHLCCNYLFRNMQCGTLNGLNHRPLKYLKRGQKYSFRPIPLDKEDFLVIRTTYSTLRNYSVCKFHKVWCSSTDFSDKSPPPPPRN